MDNKKVKKIISVDGELIQQVYAIILGHCIKQIRQELENESTFQAIDNDRDVIEILKISNPLCYNFKSHKYAPQAKHKAV